jgi:hypothetical protein
VLANLLSHSLAVIVRGAQITVDHPIWLDKNVHCQRLSARDCFAQPAARTLSGTGNR